MAGFKKVQWLNIKNRSQAYYQQTHQYQLQKIKLCAHFGLADCEVQIFCGTQERPVETGEAQHLEGATAGSKLYHLIEKLRRNKAFKLKNKYSMETKYGKFV
jgi:hypothetical protein